MMTVESEQGGATLLHGSHGEFDGFAHDPEFGVASELNQSAPSILMGKPVVAGTHAPVESIVEKLAEGETTDQLLEAHPRLSREGILAALRFAAETMRANVVYATADYGMRTLSQTRVSTDLLYDLPGQDGQAVNRPGMSMRK